MLSPPLILPPTFQNFWNWISNYFFAVNYTSYTIKALPVFCQAFQLDNNRIKGAQVLTLSKDLLFSIRYYQRPDPIRNLVFFFLNLTYRTNYFNNPVTPQLVAQLNTDIQTERNNNSNNLIDNLPVNNQNMADQVLLLFVLDFSVILSRLERAFNSKFWWSCKTMERFSPKVILLLRSFSPTGFLKVVTVTHRVAGL